MLGAPIKKPAIAVFFRVIVLQDGPEITLDANFWLSDGNLDVVLGIKSRARVKLTTFPKRPLDRAIFRKRVLWATDAFPKAVHHGDRCGVQISGSAIFTIGRE